MTVLWRVGAPMWMLVRTVGAVVRRGVAFRAVLREVHQLGVRSAPLVGAGMAFFGFVMVTIADAQARRFTGSLATVGSAYFELLLREFGPLTSALLAASRGSARYASELSSMTVNEQVEALEMTAGDPLADLVAPRVLGGLVAFPLLCILGTGSAAVSAALAAQYVYGADGWAFLDPRFVDAADVASFALKAVLCGLYVPLAASWRGLQARGGSAAVGLATTEGVVAAVLGCLVIDLVVAFCFLVIGA
jgi:phospholipid/cholesterol/gamma-HCH transport system permease protein